MLFFSGQLGLSNIEGGAKGNDLVQVNNDRGGLCFLGIFVFCVSWHTLTSDGASEIKPAQTRANISQHLFCFWTFFCLILGSVPSFLLVYLCCVRRRAFGVPGMFNCWVKKTEWLFTTFQKIMKFHWFFVKKWMIIYNDIIVCSYMKQKHDTFLTVR